MQNKGNTNDKIYQYRTRFNSESDAELIAKVNSDSDNDSE